jgi:hypothetical protein
LQQLTSLNLHNTIIHDPEIYQIVTFLGNLTNLDLSGTYITSVSCTHLQTLSLVALSLAGCCFLTDECIRYIATISSLKMLNISTNTLTDCAMNYIVWMPNLQVLSITHTFMTDYACHLFSTRPTTIPLLMISIPQNVTNTGMLYIVSRYASVLQHIDIRYCSALSNQLLTSFISMPCLKSLMLSGTSINNIKLQASLPLLEIDDYGWICSASSWIDRVQQSLDFASME